MWFFGFILLVFVVAVIAGVVKGLTSTPEQIAEMQFGPFNHQMICPHCNTTGQIRTKPIEQKKGVSGGKATAAILTGGVSLLATGLSRKEKNTQAHCMNCSNTWFF